MNIVCIGVITEVWRDNRFKGLAGIGETGDDGNVAGGSDDEDDEEVSRVIPLIPFVPSRGGRFVGATNNPALCNEAILPAIDFCPEELRERPFVRTELGRDCEGTLTLRTMWLQSSRVPLAWIRRGASC